jgi:hypothetical protein
VSLRRLGCAGIHENKPLIAIPINMHAVLDLPQVWLQALLGDNIDETLRRKTTTTIASFDALAEMQVHGFDREATVHDFGKQEEAYVGFTASTGASWEKHDILSW